MTYKTEYIYYSTDSSFDYGDFPGSTYYQIDLHGFEIALDKEDRPLLDTLEGFGDFTNEVEEHKASYQQFYDWLVQSFTEIQKSDEHATSYEAFEELAIFVKDCIKNAA